MALAAKRQPRSLALDVLEQHLSTAPHPDRVVQWRYFATHFTTLPTLTKRS